MKKAGLRCAHGLKGDQDDAKVYDLNNWTNGATTDGNGKICGRRASWGKEPRFAHVRQELPVRELCEII